MKNSATSQVITFFEGKSITLTCGSLKSVFDILYFKTCKEIASGFVLMPTKVVPPKNKVTKKRKTK